MIRVDSFILSKIPYKMIKPVFKDMIEDIIAYETFENMSDIQFLRI